jgi:acyl dehydratase
MAVLTIDEINIGDEYSKTVLFDKEKVIEFINFTQDTASIHIDKEFSNEKGFENLVVHGFGLSILFSRILGLELPGENTVIGSLNLDFHKPVYIGDTVEYTVTVKRIIKPLGSVSLELKASKTNVNETCVLGKAVCIFVNKGDKE